MDARRAVIFANGLLPDLEAARVLLRQGDTVVAADGGLHHIQALGLAPDVLIGDLDSVSTAEVESLEASHITVLRYPREKDETDLELALDWCATQDFRSILIVGALGGRLDQTLGNLFLLTWPRLAGIDVRLDDGLEEVLVVTTATVLHGAPGETVSLLPVQGPARGITTRGLRYPLNKETLWPERTRGISNEFLDDRASIELEQGCLLCIHTHKRP